MNNDNNGRATLVSLLTERGVIQPDSVADAVGDVEGAIATVAYWDDQPGDKGTGLLVWLIREGNQNGYRRPGERGKPPARTITPKLEKAIRGSCLSPNGFSRDMARDMLRPKAGALGMPVDDLIDAVMGPEWLVTLPDARHDPEAPREERIADQLRYDREQAAR